jgi:hypothetical protein
MGVAAALTIGVVDVRGIGEPSRASARSASPASPSVSLRADYGEQACEVLDRQPRIEPRGASFEMTRAESTDGDRLTTSGGLGGLVRVATPEGTRPFRMVLPASGRDPVELHIESRDVLRVHEEGVHGRAERIDGTVSYARDGGRSYWTQGEQGFEEWLELEAGRAYTGRVIARWRIEGGVPREHEGGVLIADARGAPAPRSTIRD